MAGGNYSAAQTDLTNYTTALTNLHADTWVSQNASRADALTSALQTGNTDDVQAAFAAYTSDASASVPGIWSLGFSGDVQSFTSEEQQMLPELTAQLQQVGYTSSNARAEANAIVLGIQVDDADPQISTVGTQVTSTSNLSQVGGQISDLAKAAANSSGASLLSSIIASLGKENTLTGIESTLTQLDIQYGTVAQGGDTGSGNTSQATASVRA